jgi:Spy/CpxP family protein refolding chaperone
MTQRGATKQRYKTALRKLPPTALRNFVFAFALGLTLPGLANAQVPGQPGQHKQRREELEAQIVQRFMNHVATELQLDASSRGRLESHLRQTAARRRALAQNTVELRGHLLRAARDESTPDSEFTRLINDMTRLRAQEDEMWKADQESLAKILTPRQHARFVMMWIRFNEQIRDMAMRRPGGPPPRP